MRCCTHTIHRTILRTICGKFRNIREPTWWWKLRHVDSAQPKYTLGFRDALKTIENPLATAFKYTHRKTYCKSLKRCLATIQNFLAIAPQLRTSKQPHNVLQSIKRRPSNHSSPPSNYIKKILATTTHNTLALWLQFSKTSHILLKLEKYSLEKHWIILFLFYSSFIYENKMVGCTLMINNMGFLVKKKDCMLCSDPGTATSYWAMHCSTGCSNGTISVINAQPMVLVERYLLNWQVTKSFQTQKQEKWPL